MVLDPMMGGGTTLVECRLLGRDAIGVDVNFKAVALSMRRLRFLVSPETAPSMIKMFVGDARQLNLVRPGVVDLIMLHPPYWNVIRYGGGTVEGDLSATDTLADYFSGIREVAAECFRVLKPGRICAVMAGDTRRSHLYVPLAFGVMARFLNEGFSLLESIVKIQHNVRSERVHSAVQDSGFYRISHEHLFIFRKPISSDPGEAQRHTSSMSAMYSVRSAMLDSGTSPER